MNISRRAARLKRTPKRRQLLLPSVQPQSRTYTRDVALALEKHQFLRVIPIYCCDLLGGKARDGPTVVAYDVRSFSFQKSRLNNSHMVASESHGRKDNGVQECLQGQEEGYRQLQTIVSTRRPSSVMAMCHPYVKKRTGVQVLFLSPLDWLWLPLCNKSVDQVCQNLPMSQGHTQSVRQCFLLTAS